MRFLHDIERQPARLAGHLGPARQDVVDLRRREVGFHTKAAVMLAGANLAAQLDRDRAAYARPQIDAQLGARGIVERCSQAHIGVAIGILAVVQRGRLSGDLDVALDPVALIIGHHLEGVGFELLVQRQLVDRERAEIDVDGVGRLFLGQRVLERHLERDLRDDIALAGVGIDRRLVDIAQTLGLQHLRRGRHRPLDTETHARGRGLRHQIGYFKHHVGHIELAAGRRIDAALTDGHGRGAPGDMPLHVGVANRGQPIERMQHDIGGGEVDGQPAIRNRRPATRQRVNRRVHRDIELLQRPTGDTLDGPFTNFRHHQNGPDILQHGRRHRRAGKSQRDARLRRRIIDAAGPRNSDIAIADVALRQQHPPLLGIEANPDGNAIEDHRIGVVDVGQHDGAAAEAELPVRHPVVRRLKVGEQGQAVRARCDLERRDHYAPARIPFDLHVHAIDMHRIFGRVAVDQIAFADRDIAGKIGRQTVAPDLAANHAAQRHPVGGEAEILQTRREQQVFARYLVGRDLERTNAIGWRADTDLQRPGVRSLLTHRHGDPTRGRPAQTEADILKLETALALLIVDRQYAAAQADLIEALAVEPLRSGGIEPFQQGKDTARRRLGRIGRERRRQRRGRHGRLLTRYRSAGADLLDWDLAGRQRLGGACGGDDDFAVGGDADRQFGPDQPQAFRAQPADQKRHARQSDLGLRRGGDNGVTTIAHHDVAQSHRNPDASGPLDLGATDFDGMIATQIFLDG